MSKKMKNALLVGIVVLLFSACKQVQTLPTSEPIVTSSPLQLNSSPTVVLATGLAPEKFSQYVGLNYSHIPDDLSEGISMMIENSEDYGLFLVSENQNEMLWLSKLTHHDASGNLYWQVKDILDLSAFEAGVTLIPDGCVLNNVPDSEILAVGKDGVILSAWRANTASNVFEVIPTNGLQCSSDKGTPLK